ncbi:MAG: hypothetical protein JXC36_06765 [Candidatus Atribacteria bacterium]|nr:hypothetical protein [Candidatus Atribacteria bacterium]
MYFILPYNAILDSLSFFTDKGGLLAIIRGAFLLAFAVYIIFNSKGRQKVLVSILLFSVYTLVLVLFSSDPFNSLRFWGKITVPILYFTVAYNVVKTSRDSQRLNISLIIVLIIYAITTFYFNFIGVGEKQYGEDQLMDTGPLGGATFTVFSYGLLLVPIFIYTKTISKMNALWLVLVSVFLLLFNLSRMPIMAVMFGYFIYFIHSYEFRNRYLKFIVFIGLIMIFTSPFYYVILKNQFGIREGRYEVESYETEDRFFETKIVFESVFSFKDPIASFFGKEIYNSVGHWGEGRKRGIHVDYNALLHGAGIIGLFLYLLIFYKMWIVYRNARKRRGFESFKIFNSAFVVIFFVQFLISVSGQFYVLTFRTIGFLYLGALLSLINQKNKSTNPQYANNTYIKRK